MTSPLKIAILIAIGPLDQFGYQHIYMPVLDNLAAFATRVYLCSSTRNRNGVDEILDRFPNITYISNENTWLSLNDQGQEIFSLAPLARNANILLETARADGMDCAAHFSISQYLPEENRTAFLNDCQVMMANNEPFHWMYKRIQLGNQLFEVDRKVPFIINFHYPKVMMFESDSLRLPDSGEYYRNTLGDYRDKSSITTIDAPRELTPQDLEELRSFIRNYDEINPGVDPTFIWERDGRRKVNKYSIKKFSSDALSPTGQIIARNSRPDFVSQYLLKAHPANAPWHVKLLRFIQSLLNPLPLFKRVMSKLQTALAGNRNK